MNKRYTLPTLSAVSLAMLASNAMADIQIRYNQYGYSIDREKVLVVMSDEDLKGTPFQVQRDGKIVLNDTIGDSAAGKGHYTPLEFNYNLSLSELSQQGQYEISIGEQTSPLTTATITIADRAYADIATEILSHIRVARSGSEHARLHSASHLEDANASLVRSANNASSPESWNQVEGVEYDLAGGWYDAGDYIKFSLTNALTALYLLRSYDVAPDYHNKSELSQTTLVDVLDEAKHGLDYLVKLMPSNEDFILQVGSHLDHEQGDRLPQDDTLTGYERPAFSALSAQNMAVVVAALAHGSKTFESIDPTLSKEYLEKAEQIWSIATSDQVLDFLPYDRSWFYTDYSANDNLQLAASELYNATNKQTYLDQAKAYADEAGAGYYSSWETLNILANSRLADAYTLASDNLHNDLAYFTSFANSADEYSDMDENNIWKRPMKPVWAGLYNHLQIAGHAGELAVRGDTQYLDLLYDNLDYLMGRNPWGMSFLASQNVDNPATQTYSQIIRITEAFPVGAVSEGPVDKPSHDSNAQWMIDGEEILRLASENPYNTDAEVFVDHNRDYATMETTIFGQAVALYMISTLNAYEGVQAYPAWDSNKLYENGEIVTFEDAHYQVIHSHSAPGWVPNNPVLWAVWKQL
jgi:hypothetical protein